MRSPDRKANSTASPRLWPILLVVVGAVLLLDNFFLLGDFDAVALLPLLLVVLGAQILLRGDVVPNAEARTFGITRGSVEAATLEINSGEIDVDLRALQSEGRLIAGQFAQESRPELSVVEDFAQLRMDRAQTPWLSFADWRIGLAKDLPWRLLVSTSLGKVALDLDEVILQGGVIATGLGEIRLISPQESLGSITLRSTVGNVHVVTPYGTRTRITVEAGRLFNVQVDENRYELVPTQDPQVVVYASRDFDENAPQVDIIISGTFGDAFLA